MANKKDLGVLCLSLILLIGLGGCIGQPTPQPTTPPVTEPPKPELEIVFEPEPNWNLENSMDFTVRITVNNLSDFETKDLKIVFETLHPNLYITGKNKIQGEQYNFEFKFADGGTLLKKGSPGVGNSKTDDFTIRVSLESYYTKAESLLTIKIYDTIHTNPLYKKTLTIVIGQKQPFFYF